MIAEKVLSVNWVWSVESSVNYELSQDLQHDNPIVAHPPLLERTKSWHVARPMRTLTRADVKLPLFENIHDYDVDSIMIELFQYCEHEKHSVPDIKTAVDIANKKFRLNNMRKVHSVVAHEPPVDDFKISASLYVSPHCPRDTIYVLTHPNDVGAISRHGIQFGMGIWHPGMCVGFLIKNRPTNLLDLMVGPDVD